MHIQDITLKGFQCFGDTPIKIELTKDITTLIGANGTGKTALLTGLLRLFGVTRNQRTVNRSDFHTPLGKLDRDSGPLDLWINVRLAYPELSITSPVDGAVPACFSHMVVESPNEAPFCRIRLEATWTDDGTVDGDISQKLYWVTTDDDNPSEKQKSSFAPHERGLIQLHYLPASRNESELLKYSTNLMAGRLLKAIEWSEKTLGNVKKATEKIQKSFATEPGIKVLNTILREKWADLYDSPIFKNPELQLISKDFEDVVRNLSILFNPGADGSEGTLDDLSDGQKSLFYFSLATTAFNIEREIIKSILEVSSDASKPAILKGFKEDSIQIPRLTLFGLEEPENHLAPYYLSRIIKQVRTLTKTDSAQAIVTSHSPAILSRVDPSEVRHFRLSERSHTTIVNSIHIPEEPGEAGKYIREAVISYPELYFSRFVILCEGDSEQIVLPRVAAALGLDVDPSFVAIVPLGGRHVNHFWKLLSELKIPYATLLDFDLGRAGAGWGRIKYVCDQLLAIGVDKKDLLSIEDGDGKEVILSDKKYAGMPEWEIDLTEMKAWRNFLENYGVFFSYPLDLDMSLLSRFPEEYKNLAARGPRDHTELAAKVVLKDNGPGISVYNGKLKNFRRYFKWYKYYFIGKGKPSTHLLALSKIKKGNLAQKAPIRLKKILKYADKKIRAGK